MKPNRAKILDDWCMLILLPVTMAIVMSVAAIAFVLAAFTVVWPIGFFAAPFAVLAFAWWVTIVVNIRERKWIKWNAAEGRR